MYASEKYVRTRATETLFSKASASSTSVYDLECIRYQKILFDLTEEECMKYDPLEFWPAHSLQLPILARIAAKIL